MTFWIITLVITAICWGASAIRLKAWMKRKGLTKKDIKKTPFADAIGIYALLLVPIVNILLAVVVLMATYSDEFIEHAVLKEQD